MVVVLEHASESLTTFDPASDGISIIHRFNQVIAEPLMVPFGVVVLDGHGWIRRDMFGAENRSVCGTDGCNQSDEMRESEVADILCFTAF